VIKRIARCVSIFLLIFVSLHFLTWCDSDWSDDGLINSEGDSNPIADMMTGCNSTNGEKWMPVGDVGFSKNMVKYPCLFIHDDNGDPVPYVAFSNVDYENRVSVMKYDGTSWAYVGEDTLFFEKAKDISLFVYDNNGAPVPYVAYSDHKDGLKNDGSTVLKFNGTDWVVVGEEAFSGIDVKYTSLFVYNDNGFPVPYIAYREERSWGYSNGATVMKYNGVDWEVVGERRFSKDDVEHVSLFVYNDNGVPVPYVAYRDDRKGSNNDGATVMKYNGIDWEVVGDECFSWGDAKYVSLSVYDNNGAPVPYVAYSDKLQNSSATVMKFNGIGWERVGAGGFSEAEAQYISLFVYDDSGTPLPYIAYRDKRPSVLLNDEDGATVMRFDGMEWEVVGKDRFSKSDVKYTSLYVYQGMSYIAYRDEGNGDRITVMKYEPKISEDPVIVK